MYSGFRQFAERVLRIPPDPGPPPGDEASSRIFHAAPSFFRYLLVIWALKTGGAILSLLWFAVPATIGIVSLARKGHPHAWWLMVIPGVLLLLVLAARVFALAAARLDYEKRWYIVTDRSLRVREGVVVVREMTVTFANIQNISVSQGPIQRVLRIADLRVDTAGGGAGGSEKNMGTNLHTAWFRGVDNAAEVRGLIERRLRRLRDAGLGDGGPGEGEPEDRREAPGVASSSRALAAPSAAAVRGSLAGRLGASPPMLAALREAYSEAAALRRSAEARPGSADGHSVPG